MLLDRTVYFRPDESFETFLQLYCDLSMENDLYLTYVSSTA